MSALSHPLTHLLPAPPQSPIRGSKESMVDCCTCRVRAIVYTGAFPSRPSIVLCFLTAAAAAAVATADRPVSIATVHFPPTRCSHPAIHPANAITTTRDTQGAWAMSDKSLSCAYMIISFTASGSAAARTPRLFIIISNQHQ